MPYRLYDFAASPFCIKVRSLLDYKKIPFTRISVVGPALVRLHRRGKIGKVPALEMDGHLVCDSTDIAYAVEERHREPKTIPTSPRERAQCHVLEDWSDESLYFFGLYYRWIDPEGRKNAGEMLGNNPATRAVMSATLAAGARLQVFQQGTGRKPADHVARDLTRQLQSLSDLLADKPFLLADTPLLCDFAVGGQLVYLDRTPHGGREISNFPNIFSFMSRLKELRHK